MPQLDSGYYLWEDWLHLQDAQTNYFRPASVTQLLAFLSAFDPKKLHIRGIGSGHSTTDVARPWRRSNDAQRAGIVVLQDKMPLAFPDAAKAWWKSGVEQSDKLVRVEAGATIAALNQRFQALDRAFPNLGSYDAQTILGAIATGTHGTGLVTPPLCDLVASIELITYLPDSNGKPALTQLRIEPPGGPTDATAFVAAKSLHGMELMVDEDAFYSCVVGLGFFGIVTAVTLRLTDAFWLDEVQRLEPWGQLKTKLPAEADHPNNWFDFLLSTRKTKAGGGGVDYKCLVTTRTRQPSKGPGSPRNDYRREQLVKKGYTNQEALTKHLAGLASSAPRFANFTTVNTLKGEVDRVQKPSSSYHIFKTSIGDLVYATSAEVSIPFADVVKAVDAITANTAALDKENLHHTSPFGVRFSQPSKHYLAMAYDRKTCTIEAPMLLHSVTHKGKYAGKPSHVVIEQVLSRFRDAMRAAIPSARFHHGQLNFNTKADLEAYPKYAKWKAQYDRFNAFGVFSNNASKRWGL